MSIRCAAKALIFDGNQVLLNRCRHSDGTVYYDLPGGGQHTYESMTDAVVREVLEETGYRVSVLRPVAFSEEIYTDPGLRTAYPDYTHRICHIFLCKIHERRAITPSEPDLYMEKSEWISLDNACALENLCPPGLASHLGEIASTDRILFLGTHYSNDTDA